jgi:arachidonate 15-lipoxygenase (second type) / 8-lipoxygenase (S-type)
MERLSTSPFSLRRIHPNDELPFDLPVDVVFNVTESPDLNNLQSQGRLFYADHSPQLMVPKTERYLGACSAYFYMHPKSDEFLPLAIKTNTDADLIYTPLDAPNDWLLAKIMMNSNEAIFNEVYHVAATHAVQEIVYLAALRNMHKSHPLLALMERLMYGAFAPRIVGEAVLVNEGGLFDTFTGITGAGAAAMAEGYYHSGAGAFQPNYFVKQLADRGLVNCTWGPPLKHFPFFEDASAIHRALRQFMTQYVYAYYLSPEILRYDQEVSGWVREAIHKANVIDFPEDASKHREVLIDVLTHMAHLSVVHNVLNGNSPVSISSTLPFHPASLHAPLPRQKGVDDLMTFLPNASTTIEEIRLFASFGRPSFVAKNLTLLYSFSDDKLLSRANDRVREAEKVFLSEMLSLSERIQSRHFDADGLSEGMPFLWTGLDPAKIPLSSVV